MYQQHNDTSIVSFIWAKESTYYRKLVSYSKGYIHNLIAYIIFDIQTPKYIENANINIFTTYSSYRKGLFILIAWAYGLIWAMGPLLGWSKYDKIKDKHGVMVRISLL